MRLKLFAIAMLIFFVLIGCGTNYRDGATGNRNNVEPTRYNDNLNRTNRMGATDNYTHDGHLDGVRTRHVADGTRDGVTRHDRTGNYAVSKEAADRITNDIREIRHAYVLTTNRNAYVAAVLNDNRTGNRNQTNMTDGHNRNYTNTTDGTRTHTNRLGTATDTGHELTDEVKNRITKIVKSVDNNIDNVYVTTNPDFADLANNYITDVNAGKPVRGFFDQLGNMIERVFPQNHR